MEIKDTNNTKPYSWGDGAFGWHLLKNDELSVIEEEVPAFAKEVRHYHKHSQQLFYVLSGKVSIEINSKQFDLIQGQSIHVPKNTAHQLKNLSDQTCRFLVISQPKSHGDRVDLEN